MTLRKGLVRCMAREGDPKPEDILWAGVADSRLARIIRHGSGSCYAEVFEGDSVKGGYRTAIGELESDAVYLTAFLHTKKQLDEILELRASINATALARGRASELARGKKYGPYGGKGIRRRREFEGYVADHLPKEYRRGEMYLAEVPGESNRALVETRVYLANLSADELRALLPKEAFDNIPDVFLGDIPRIQDI